MGSNSYEDLSRLEVLELNNQINELTENIEMINQSHETVMKQKDRTIGRVAERIKVTKRKAESEKRSL